MIRLYPDLNGEPDGSSYIELYGFRFGDTNAVKRAQGITETAGGYMGVVDRGYRQRVVAGECFEITHEKAQELEVFFVETLQMAMNRFWIYEPNNRQGIWNPKTWTLFMGCYISAAIPTMDGTYNMGDKAELDYRWIGPLRTSSNEFKLATSFEGIYRFSLKAVIERDERI